MPLRQSDHAALARRVRAANAILVIVTLAIGAAVWALVEWVR